MDELLPEVAEKKKPKDKKHYVTNKDLLQALMDYRNSGCTDQKAYNKLGDMFLKLATRILTKPNFFNYSEDRKQDMIQDSVLRMLKNMHKFDPEAKTRTGVPNPFFYFSEITHNQIYSYINEEKKHATNTVNVGFVDNLENVSEDWE